MFPDAGEGLKEGGVYAHLGECKVTREEVSEVVLFGCPGSGGRKVKAVLMDSKEGMWRVI